MEIIKKQYGKKSNQRIKAPNDLTGKDLFEMYVLPRILLMKVDAFTENEIRKTCIRIYKNGLSKGYHAGIRRTKSEFFEKMEEFRRRVIKEDVIKDELYKEWQLKQELIKTA